MKTFTHIVALSLVLGLTACGGDDPAKLGEKCEPGEEKQCVSGLVCDAAAKRCLGAEGFVCDPAADHCVSTHTCAETTAGDNKCHLPVFLTGRVTSTAGGAAVSGAHVIASNEERTPVTDVAVTGAGGDYDLEIPVVRDATGAPTAAKFTLRGSAKDFQTFPSGIRQALPIEANTATKLERGWVIDSALTDLGLIPLETTGLASIKGRVDGTIVGGVLVVAEIDAGGAVEVGTGVSALTDRAGNFTIFNVPAASYTLRGYRADVQLTPAAVTVATADVTNVVLSPAGAVPGELTGGVIDNSPDFSETSVVLIPKAVFDPVNVRGEVPPGLRAPRYGAPNVLTSFTITGVPDGEYVVLAAFENDGLVRDESGGGNTAIVEVKVPDTSGARTFTISTSFKVRSGLPVLFPGADAPEAVNAPFHLSWGRFSNARRYDVQVIDALGDLVWEKLDIPQPGGNAPVTQAYEGPALEAGMIYQFRASAWDELASPNGFVLSRTEDLRGTFYLAP